MADDLLNAQGFEVFAPERCVADWARAAYQAVQPSLADPAKRAANLRHGQTWFVGVDALPNSINGRVGDTPLGGLWRSRVRDLPLHPAQVSVMYQGYPKRDADESAAAHRFRRNRCAAHVDGLLPHGPQKRRFAIEHHAYIAAIPLNNVDAAPTVVWKNSHTVMQTALVRAIGAQDPRQVDVTDVYQAARREVFDTCEQIPLQMKVGQVALIHRFTLHGTAPWGASPPCQDGRQIAFFRPTTSAHDWLGSEF
ncbi:hypothetical protein [Nereida sp. MMG025]|uniref:hypothetical protein n=1 Tax=Nereida sp. MMG025 TaxID=2909981 RepID=UPI001F2B046C|nr:hypothetical protein [Nereida sp. MMG025]MCF6445399.1 hypothetical protein [Nereida sp. MMG025]